MSVLARCSPRASNLDQSHGNNNPMLSRRATAAGGNPVHSCYEPDSSFALHTSFQRLAGEMSKDDAALPRTPPLTMFEDNLYRRASPPGLDQAEGSPDNTARVRCAAHEVTPTTPNTPRSLADRREAATNCLRKLSLTADCSPLKQASPPKVRPRKIPFIVVALDGSLQVHPAAAQVLTSREGKTKSIRLLSVFGGPRSGKSTLIERGFFALDLEPDDPDHIPGLGSRYDEKTPCACFALVCSEDTELGAS